MAILFAEGKVLIAQRKADPRYPGIAGLWEFPGGKLEPSETPQLCLVRELREELDIVVRVGDFFGRVRHHGDYGDVELLAYRTYHQSGVPTPNVHQRYAWATPEELSRYTFLAADVPLVQQIQREARHDAL
ncbi:MAG: (deoxy)nucleoside triphosphate pyrophosphohydrolase [Trueperaceae bacterium]|nr:(deoxy)nucleoside triphosphate pyrophosphohydrolase [Trueperaceae bacterium]